MYKRLNKGKMGYVEEFLEGLEIFLTFASQQPNLESEGKIRCPCKKCKNKQILPVPTVRAHILRRGFIDDYYYWTCHGEEAPSINPFCDDHPVNANRSYNVHHGETSGTSNMSDYSHVNRYEDMIYDAAGLGSTNFGEQNMEETPNIDAHRFYEMLNQAQEPLWSGCETHSALSAALRMMSLKSDYNMPVECFNEMCQYMSEALPSENKAPTDFYRTKKMVSGLGMTSKIIDCCENGCMLYWNHDEHRRECKFCETPRYKERRGKKVARQRMHYLPLTPRLQRLYASKTTASHMRWHQGHGREEGVMRHPSDGEAWKHFDRTYPAFASEPRNVRLGLCTDGFNPFGHGSTPYSCWPVIVTPYNLPPELCMTSPYMFLTMIIPGPRNPKSKIDVYLQPLIDELQQLWSEGVWTFDASMNQNFNLRASLMWTIGDFPAYGMLSGWSTCGKLACPICMKNGKGFRLKNGRKNSWFDCHRKFLRHDHPYRRNTNDFKGGKKEFSFAHPRMSGDELWNEVHRIPRIIDTGSQVRFPGYGEAHNWTKRNIFWDLPYWKDNLIQHNLDVMHIEKNVFDNVFHTIMDNKDRTKDNVRARLDLQEICRRPDLHLESIANGKYRKPKASYCLSRSQKDDVCEWIQGLKMPDNYASNIARCVDKENARLFGLRSHDCHILMQRLLPMAFSALPNNVLNPIIELSQFFRDLCSTVIREEHLLSMEDNIPIIICKLERLFPPAFFDVMEHLPVHLPREALMGGPVHYRWMYPFER